MDAKFKRGIDEDSERVLSFLYKRCTGYEGQVIQAAERMTSELLELRSFFATVGRWLGESDAERNADNDNPGIHTIAPLDSAERVVGIATPCSLCSKPAASEGETA